MKWNPRYVAYCNSLGLTPEQEQARRKAEGKNSTDFICWSSQRIREWLALGNERHELRQLGRYDVWLAEKYPSPTPVELRSCAHG